MSNYADNFESQEEYFGEASNSDENKWWEYGIKKGYIYVTTSTCGFKSRDVSLRNCPYNVAGPAQVDNVLSQKTN